ncbi:Laminin G, subdomain protein 2 domain protein [Rhodopirellula maiorica SM1]|uniref:Laminin G, subdomain protein 2 domain protein n=1 Tax=Rhodopirellula maiorica SM1 TaxID=1265738 RepID=M5R9B2_9BACT|nr:Laminin G, subdomain protein 2 domain protein [Rhodopirellula maiorica SM1]
MAREFDFYPLEDRILLSGDGLDASDGGGEIDLDLAAALLQQLDDADGEAIDPTTQVASQPSNNDDTQGTESTHTIIDAPDLDPANPIEVVFVDASIEDADTLIATLRDGSQEQTQWLIIRLDADRDGIEQISQTMASLSGVDAIHLLSHGDGESIALGSTRLDAQTSQAYVSDIARWGVSLDADASISIYGSDLASTESGRELIEVMAAVCDCDIANRDGSLSGPETVIPRQEVAFVDTSIQGYQQLVDDLLSSSGASRQIDVFLLDATRDGISQISEVLRSYDGLDSIHVVSHGLDGGIQLGNTWVGSDTLAIQAEQVRNWGNALTADGDLLFYGCDFASNADGQLLVGQFSQLTGADVAASVDLTGHQSLGGDWDLEYHVGAIETNVAFSLDVQQAWTEVLEAAVDTTSTGTSTGGTVTVSHATSGTNRLMLVGVSLNQAAGETVTSVTYGSQNLTLVGVEENGDARIEIWSLVAPDIGTANVQVNFSGTTDGNTVGVTTFTGVDQSTPLGTFASNSAASGGTATTTVTSAADEVVFSVVAVDDTVDYNLIPGTGQTERWDLLGGGDISGGGSTQTGAASTNVEWTWSGNDNWALGGVSIKSVANTSGLQGHWTFDSGVGALDSSGNSYDGTLVGNAAVDTTTSTNQIGDGKLTLDGTGDYVDVSAHVSNFALLSEGTLSAWVNVSSTDFETIFDISNGGTSDFATLGVENGQLTWTLNASTVSLVRATSTAQINDGNWHHVAVSTSASGTSLYIDGVELTGSAVTYASGSAASTQFLDDLTGLTSMQIGAFNTGSLGGEFNGFIDDARVYDNGLTASDVAALASVTTNTSFQQNVGGYTGTQDTEIRQASATSSYGSATSIAIDTENSGANSESQGLLRFDNLFGSNGGQIPYGVQIVSASLTVETTGDTSGTISLHRMLNNWNESSTWDSVSGGLSANGSELALAADSQLVPPSSGATTFTGLEDTVQAWANGDSNYGWGILSDSSNGWDFDSSEGTTVPLLSVQYIMPGSQASVAHTLTVDTTSDVSDGNTTSIDALLADKGADGFISLREAIMAANNTKNLDASTEDVINFGIAGTGVHTFSLTAALPMITDAVIIDGYSQSGASVNTLSVGNDAVLTIELDGSSAGNANGIYLGEGSDGSTIKGLIINRFAYSGIQISSTGNSIVGNFIGTDSTGSSDLGNSRDGITISANNNLIGSASAADRNVISGNNDEAIDVDAGYSGTIIQGNYIGTNADGTAAVPNGQNSSGTWGGVLLDGGGNTVGGSGAGEGNLISGNYEFGILIHSSGNTIQGNLIGTDAAGTSSLGNQGEGIGVGSNASNNTIGGTADGAGNTIAYNTGVGVELTTSGTGNSILGNAIYSNGGLGIDLGGDGVTANDGQFDDTPDQDTGANNLQNFPVLSSITAGPTPVVVGSLKSTPSRTFRIEFFANASGDASGYGEGQRYVGYIEVTTNATGDATIGHYLDGFIATGETVSATATDLTTNDTSEFAANITATNVAPVLDSGQSPVLTAQNEDSGVPSGAVGTLISSLVDFASPTGQVDNVTDSDLGAALGIAITAADTTYGSWYYSTDGGSSWNSLGAVSDSNARLLAADADTRLYFQPNANYNGSVANAITFRAWDQSTGTNGDTSTITLASQNVLDSFSSVSYGNNNGSQSWSANWVESDSSGGAASSGRFRVSGGELSIQAANANDYIYREVDLSDAANATLSFSYSSGLGSSATVHAQISDDGGASYTTLSGGVFNSSTNTGSGTKSFDISGQMSANTRIRFLVAAGETGAGVNNFSVDNVEITYDVPGGGTTAFSSETDTSSLVINAVNDAPVLSSGAPAAVNVSEDSANSSAVSLGMSGLTYGVGGGSDESGQSLTYTITNIPSHITLWKADGTTQVSNNATLTLSELQGLMYKTVADAFGSGNLTWTVQDDGGTANGGNDTLAQSMSITVNAVDDAPVAVDDSYSVDENGTLVVGPSTDNLVNHWEMNEGGSNQTTVDSGSAGNDATLGADASANTDDPAWSSGHIGSGALSFDGSSDYVATSSTVLKTATSFTLSTWFQTDKTSGQQHILWQGYSGGNGYGSSPGTTAQSEMGLTIGSYDQANKLVFFMGYDVPANGADAIMIVSDSDFTDTTQFHNVAVVVTDMGGVPIARRCTSMACSKGPTQERRTTARNGVPCKSVNRAPTPAISMDKSMTSVSTTRRCRKPKSKTSRIPVSCKMIRTSIAIHSA